MRSWHVKWPYYRFFFVFLLLSLSPIDRSLARKLASNFVGRSVGRSSLLCCCGKSVGEEEARFRSLVMTTSSSQRRKTAELNEKFPPNRHNDSFSSSFYFPQANFIQWRLRIYTEFSIYNDHSLLSDDLCAKWESKLTSRSYRYLTENELRWAC